MRNRALYGGNDQNAEALCYDEYHHANVDDNANETMDNDNGQKLGKTQSRTLLK